MDGKDFKKISVNRFGKNCSPFITLSTFHDVIEYYSILSEGKKISFDLSESELHGCSKKEWQYLLFKQNKNKNKLNRSKQNLQKYVEHAKEKNDFT